MEYSLRSASHDDYDFLRELHRLTMREYVEQTWGWDEEKQTQIFKEDFIPEELKVIISDMQDAGVLQVQDRPAEVFIRGIQIHPDHQGKGLGTRIIEDIIADARAKNLPVALQVLKVNPAKGLYERIGFQVAGETETHHQMKFHHDNK